MRLFRGCHDGGCLIITLLIAVGTPRSFAIDMHLAIADGSGRFFFAACSFFALYSKVLLPCSTFGTNFIMALAKRSCRFGNPASERIHAVGVFNRQYFEDKYLVFIVV